MPKPYLLSDAAYLRDLAERLRKIAQTADTTPPDEDDEDDA